MWTNPLPVYIGFLISVVLLYLFWVKPDIGEKQLDSFAPPWHSLEGGSCLYRIAVLVLFLVMFSLVILMKIGRYRN